MSDHAKLVLPEAPLTAGIVVRAWEEPVWIETYEPHAPDRNPMFLERRVYQGSSGKVYPLPFFERIARESRPRLWRALHIENEYLRVMILPELGGRIHIGFDKTNGYDFLYRQNVIKPALVGLAGPWVSGGIEFNWPQHHRPATYMPVQTHIESHADGAVTIWCTDHDPFERMKGTHGVCLHPGKALLELKVRLYNRTMLTQTFLWWANAATRVHELYQSFFPPDVHFVADHARRAMSTYPLCSGTYYGVDYGKRAKEGVPREELPSNFLPPGTYAPNDLRWYANIPVPTSYMALGSEDDFMGGYDHRQRAGVVHVANRHIAPGKKQWTWGNHEFGYSWDRLLTDADGPYIELMAGVYTDNQPDFSFLAPGETKTFSQFWYPIQEIRVPQAANTKAACRVERAAPDELRVGICATEELNGIQAAVLTETSKEAKNPNWTGNVAPGKPVEFTLRCSDLRRAFTLFISDGSGNEILRYSPPASMGEETPPAPATEPPLPADVQSVEELFLIGRHLSQYRHATRDPVDYWTEALRRDPAESRCHEALALWRLRRGEFVQAESHLESAVARLTQYNANPASGSAYYHLGLVRRFLGKDEAAYAALYKATWNYDFRSAAHYALAEIDSGRGRFSDAVAHLERSLRTNSDDLRTRNLLAVLLRKSSQEDAAAACIAENLALDPTDYWTRYLLDGIISADNRTRLDIALDYSRAGLFAEATSICASADFEAVDGSLPILLYLLAFFCSRMGDNDRAEEWLKKARAAAPELCFPNRLEEMIALQWVVTRNPSHALAHYYLGNLYYDRRRYEEAITAWEASVQFAVSPATAWRNLGIAYVNARNDLVRARSAYEEAFLTDTGDARVFFERDQLWKRIGIPQGERCRELESRRDLVDNRDDLSLELIALYNQSGDHDEALKLLMTRSFQPWEGGEGLVTEQYVRTRVALGRVALIAGNLEAARGQFEAALESPHNLGEATHLLANRANVYFWLGETFLRLGMPEEAERCWQRAIATERDFQEMSVQPFSAMSFYRVLAYQRAGRDEEARRLLDNLRDYTSVLSKAEPKIDYFATSLPNTLLFKEDLGKKQELTAKFLMAQVSLASGELQAGTDLLHQILEIQPSHGAASDLLKESDCLEQLGLFRNPEHAARESRS